MGVFCVLIFVPVMLQHFTVNSYSIDYQKKNQRALAFFFGFLTLLIMLRHESIGNDTKNYFYIFRSISDMTWKDVDNYYIESGYSYFNKLVSVFTDSPQVFVALCALISMILIYRGYKRLCSDAALTVSVFCVMSTFVMMFSGIRQVMAIGIGFLAYEFTRQKKLLLFIVAVAVAMSLHISAFMLIFMYPLWHARITKKWLWFVVPSLMGAFVFNRQIFTMLNFIISRFTRYDGQISSTGAYTMLILLAAFTVFAFVIPDESKITQETIGLRNFLLLALVIQMFAPLHNLAMRMSYYYIIFIPLLIPEIIRNKSERWSQVAVAARYIMVAFFIVYFFYRAGKGGNLNVFPYHFFWESV